MWADVLADAVLCALYIALNAGLNFANRWALGVHSFKFPLTLTLSHMLLNPVLLLPMMVTANAYRSEHGRILRGNWPVLLLIAVLNGIQIALNNSSLVHIELSMNQVIRAAMPVVVAVLQSFRGSPPPLNQALALVVVSAGVMMVVYQNAARAETFGILLVTLSISLQAAQMSFAGSLLSAKLDSFQITFYTSPMAVLPLAAPTVLLEGSKFQAYALEEPTRTATVLIGTCLMAVLYNVVMFQTIRRLNAIGSAVLGNVKIVVLLLLSSIILGEMRNWTPRQYFGLVLTFGGAALYSAQKLQASKPKTT